MNTDIEFKAEMKSIEYDAARILKQLRKWMMQVEKNPTYNNRSMVKYYCERADDLFFTMNKKREELPDKNFKSLMEQLREGAFYNGSK